MRHLMIISYFVFISSEAYSCNIQTWNPFTNYHIAALILARGGSKGIPLKNLAKISYRPLIKIAVDAVSQVEFSSVWVSTDHEKIFEAVKSVNVHWRSKESATDEAGSILGVLDFIENHPEVDVVALIQCTSPFIKKEYLEKALTFSREGYECVFAATRSYKLRWMEFENNIQPLNFDIKNRPRRQDWKGELVENGMFYFATRKLIKKGLLQNSRYSVANYTQNYARSGK